MSGKENIIMIIITQAKERENLDEILSVLIPVFFFIFILPLNKNRRSPTKNCCCCFFIIIQSEMLRIPTGSRYIFYFIYFVFLKKEKKHGPG
jgi:hypothetical protein